MRSVLPCFIPLSSGPCCPLTRSDPKNPALPVLDPSLWPSSRFPLTRRSDSGSIASRTGRRDLRGSLSLQPDPSLPDGAIRPAFLHPPREARLPAPHGMQHSSGNRRTPPAGLEPARKKNLHRCCFSIDRFRGRRQPLKQDACRGGKRPEPIAVQTNRASRDVYSRRRGFKFSSGKSRTGINPCRNPPRLQRRRPFHPPRSSFCSRERNKGKTPHKFCSDRG